MIKKYVLKKKYLKKWTYYSMFINFISHKLKKYFDECTNINMNS